MRIITLVFSVLLLTNASNAQQFKVHFTKEALPASFSGHVILYLSAKNENPKNGITWPCYGKEVNNLEPGEPIVFDDSSSWFPVPLSKLKRGEYYVQAVFDRNLGGRTIGGSAGNMYSMGSKKVTLDKTDETFEITCDKVVPKQTFINSTYIQELKAPSKLLSNFHNRPITIDAPVILPKEYWSEPNRSFPVLFTIAGYGSDYHHYSTSESSDTMPANPIDTIACIRVYLDGNSPLGHTCYANSANNGPWGDAFVKEFLSELQKRFRCNGAFLLRGHSSGGFASLWLQVMYPTVFAGCNSSAPDPVDFHGFGQTNLYEDDFYRDDANTLIMGAVHYGDDSAVQAELKHHNIEDVLYRGEQTVSFDAVFSAKAKNGMPEQLLDFKTGKINHEVFRHWIQYDISRYLKENVQKLKSLIGDKVRISVGTEDKAQNPAIYLMEKNIATNYPDIHFNYYPGNHFTVVTPEYKKAEMNWLRDKYLEWQRRK